MEQEFEYGLENLPDIVQEVWDRSKGRKIWLLKGDLGAGKTTFVAQLAKFLGVIDEVSSPTFSIINEYRVEDGQAHDIFTLYHADLYRLKDLDEVIDAGVEHMMNQPQSLVVIEWPDVASEILLSNTLSLEILRISDHKRKISIK